ncbi:methyltransferase family protein [Hydrogenophaga crassostreae]|uniref:methyltransferase family protein n=1 Tax=Hydrogenophaga crassostreae TaxID=1763535 RepID=UPI0018D4A5D7|nr:isoprenylcysteine carboxylmethyltransferase family protein [Hydrogenophaga crassostreae]
MSVIDYRSAGALPMHVFVIGWVLLVSGFGLAFYITGKLGWRDAHGEAGSLTTTGWYGWSRNPIYVVTIFGLLGLGLVAHSLFVYPLVAIWALLYVLAPLLEEPWLERHFGQSYEDYARQVPRFIGVPHKEGK